MLCPIGEGRNEQRISSHKHRGLKVNKGRPETITGIINDKKEQAKTPNKMDGDGCPSASGLSDGRAAFAKAISQLEPITRWEALASLPVGVS